MVRKNRTNRKPEQDRQRDSRPTRIQAKPAAGWIANQSVRAERQRLRVRPERQHASQNRADRIRLPQRNTERMAGHNKASGIRNDCTRWQADILLSAIEIRTVPLWTGGRMNSNGNGNTESL